MTIKFFLLNIIIILFISCAAQGPASGGPPDTVGPILISVQPPNQTLEITPDQKITLSFNELLDPISIPASITIEEDYKLKVRGRRIIIIPDNNWPINHALNINLSRKIRDYQKNIMVAPIQLVYSTGTKILDGHISGNIEGYYSEKIIGVGLFNWPIHDSSMVIRKIEADEKGFFKFEFIDYGKYTLGAIEGILTDFDKEIRKKYYAMATSDYISLTPTNKTQHVKMLLSKPLERLKITSVVMENQYCTKLIMNDQSEENFIIDSLLTPGDSVKINITKYNRLETYSLPEYTFILPEITDTTGPTYKGSEFSPEALRLTFSEPVHLTSGAVVTEQDTLDIALNFNMENSFTVILSNLSDTITYIKLLGNYIQDWQGNIMVDSIKKVSINRIDKKEGIIIGGKILGSVIYFGKEYLMVEALNIANDDIYTAPVNNQKFKLENLPAGLYKLWAFETLHKTEPNTYFSGTWEPYNRAARFTIYPDSVDVRARWDIEGIVIDFE